MTTTEHAHHDLEETLVENWDREDPDLTPAEKETTFRFSKDDDLIHIHTDEAGLGRRLIQHPESIIDEVTTLVGGVKLRANPHEVPDDCEIVGLRCCLPIGALSVITTPRKSSQHSRVVSHRVQGGHE